MIDDIVRGDALETLKGYSDKCIDCLVTDPPYGYNFMGKDWDKALVSVDTWKECLRVLKPGAFAFIMSAPRQDVLSRMIVNLQDAGFETDFTSIYWTYASGFPKAKNLKNGSYAGFQPKPAVEVILVCMKPLSEKSYVDQALANKKGVTWLDSCRIPYQNEDDKSENERLCTRTTNTFLTKGLIQHGYEANQKGRFPANLLVSDDVLNDGKIHKSSPENDMGKGWGDRTIYGGGNETIKRFKIGDSGSYSRYFDLDKWFDTTFPFLITPKASKSERTRSNSHPTVKPLKLMSYLITLGSRQGDTILDPFCGSGTTLVAARLTNRKPLGIDLDAQYIEIANKRLGVMLERYL